MVLVLINGIYLAERAKMSADWPFVQVIIREFGVRAAFPKRPRQTFEGISTI
jgi:hypothetical protein